MKTYLLLGALVMQTVGGAHAAFASQGLETVVERPALAARCPERVCELAAGELRHVPAAPGQIGLKVPGSAPGAEGKDAKAYVWPDHAVPFAFAYDAARQRLSLSVDGVTSAHTGLAARSARGEPARSLWLRLQGGNNRSSVELTGLFLTTAGGTEALDDVQARAATGELAVAGLDATQDWVLEGQIRFADADELTAAFSLTDLAAQHVLTSLP